MAYYDRIAKQWHKATGYEGGAFKELVLNDRILELIPGIEGQSILELGAGNLRVPVVVRSLDNYRKCLTEAGFEYREQELYPTPEVLNAKSGLKNAGKIPLAVVYRCKPCQLKS